MPMDEFWIPLLTTLILLHQTTSASDTAELIRAVGESVTFHTHDTTDGNAFWNFGTVPIVAVSFKDPSKSVYSNEKFKTRFAVSKKGRELSISQLTLQDSGKYSVKINGKTSTFTLHVYRELAEPTVTCEAQICSGRKCCACLRCSVSGTGIGKVSHIWRVGHWPWHEGPGVLCVNKSSLEELGPLTCMAWNAVSRRNVTITNFNVLCAETTVHPPSPAELPPPVHIQPGSRVSPSALKCPRVSPSTQGNISMSDQEGAVSISGVTTWLVAGGGVVVLLLLLLLLLRKFKGGNRHCGRPGDGPEGPEDV